MRRALLVSLFLAASSISNITLAAPFERTATGTAIATPYSPLGATFGVLSATHGGGGGALSRAPRGVFIGADSGGAVMLASGEQSARGAWAFGARIGYQWRNGLSLDGRFDDLGLDAPSGGGPLLIGSAGLRFGLPLVVMPYAEARTGAVFYGSHSAPTAGIGLGVGIPVFRHLSFDLGARDWITDIDGAVRHVPTFELGLAVGFDGHG